MLMMPPAGMRHIGWRLIHPSAQKMNSRKFAATSSPAAPRSYAPRTADAPLYVSAQPPLATFVARICYKSWRLAMTQSRENFPSALVETGRERQISGLGYIGGPPAGRPIPK